MNSNLQYDFFFFNDTATTEIYTLSLHDALPIYGAPASPWNLYVDLNGAWTLLDRKSTRLNSSHRCISYAVFCLKKKKTRNRFVLPPSTLPQQRHLRQTRLHKPPGDFT